MKNYSLLIIVFACIVLTSCNNKEEQIEIQKSVYENAIKYRDSEVARTAMYNILALEGDSSTYKDSLLNFYFSTRMYPQSLFLSIELIEENPEDTTIREILAVSRESLGILKEALEDYGVLYETTKNINHLYQMASIQLRLKRYEECASSLGALFTSASADSTEILITYGKQGTQQRVPLKAAVLNLNGFLNFELKDFNEARVSFEKAVELFPKFELAIGNLELLDKIEKQIEEKGKKG